jgi:hypothetical protein
VQHLASKGSETGLSMRSLQARANPCNARPSTCSGRLGKRFESARRLSLFGLSKPNTWNSESPRLITGGVLIPLAAQHPATLLTVLYLRFYASVTPLDHAAAV